MANAKIIAMLAAGDRAEADRADAVIDDAVNEPVNANERITAGILAAVDTYNGTPVINPQLGNPEQDPSVSGNTARIDRLERTLKELCRTQMTLPKETDFND